MDNITQLLGGDKLPPEIQSVLQEHFDKKVAEVREQAEATLREEFARRYEHDKESLVEAIDRMLSDVITRQETEKNDAVTRFVEARTAFRKAINESFDSVSKRKCGELIPFPKKRRKAGSR